MPQGSTTRQRPSKLTLTCCRVCIALLTACPAAESQTSRYSTFPVERFGVLATLSKVETAGSIPVGPLTGRPDNRHGSGAPVTTAQRAPKLKTYAGTQKPDDVREHETGTAAHAIWQHRRQPPLHQHYRSTIACGWRWSVNDRQGRCGRYEGRGGDAAQSQLGKATAVVLRWLQARGRVRQSRRERRMSFR